MVWTLATASVHTKANPIEWQQYFDLQTASVHVQGNPIQFVMIWLLASAKVHTEGNAIEFEPSGVAYLDLATAKIHVSANPIDWQMYFDLSTASVSVEGNPIAWQQFFDLATAQIHVQGNDIAWTVSGTAYFDLHTGSIHVKGHPISFHYQPVDEIPDLIANRSGDYLSAVINVLNPIPAYTLTLWRTDNHIGESVQVASVPVTELPYTNPNLEVNGNYRYVGAYALPGNIGGQPVLETGNESIPRITIGKNRSLS